MEGLTFGVAGVMAVNGFTRMLVLTKTAGVFVETTYQDNDLIPFDDE